MRHSWLIATRSWRTSPARSGMAVLAVALGVGLVVWVTCCYESVRQSVTNVVLDWIGRSHLSVEPVEGVWAVFGEDVEQVVREVPGVLRTTPRTREYVEAAPAPTATATSLPLTGSREPVFDRIELTGIRPDSEPFFRNYKLISGRFLQPGDSKVIVLEEGLASEFQLPVGAEIILRDADPPNPAERYRVIGIVDRRRASLNQAAMGWMSLPEVQRLCKLPGKIKAVDAILSDSTVDGIQRASADLRKRLDRRAEQAGGAESEKLEINTTEAQHKKLGAAQGLLQFIMALLSCVVLLTALFIILASMSIGVTERIAELGLLRCIGMTRRQLGWLVLVQAFPLGIAGTLLGLPLGWLLQVFTRAAAADYLGEMVLSGWGIRLAMAGGLGTTLIGAVIPAISAMSVSPVRASRPQASGGARRLVWVSAIVGMICLVGHHLLEQRIPETEEAFGARAVAGIVLLYCGFAMLAPAVVVLLGKAAVVISARVLGLRPQLLDDQVDKSPFRAATVSSGLMVGLSLIVGLVVWGESVKRGWEFPKEFPDAMLYSYAPLPLDEVRALRATPGVAQFTVADDFTFALQKPSIFRPFKSLLDQFSRFLAIDPDSGLQIVKLAYIEGSEADARAKLKKGGHLLVTREFAKARKIHLGDTIKIWVNEIPAQFVIAGVVASPGLDIAISFFNATTYFQTYAVGAVIGTLDDAERLFHRRYGKLVLINFDLPKGDESRISQTHIQAIRHTPSTIVSDKPNFALGPGPLPGDGPEERIVNQMLAKLGYPPKAFVTARELKRQIERNIDRVTMLLSAIPLIALIISAVALANLMAANVAGRAKQIAVLRAIGVTQSQVLRMVIGEGFVVGLLGSVLGLGLGILLGRASNLMTSRLSGFDSPLAVPWGLVALGAALATALCLVAALVPARHASRSNIVAVLSDL